MLQKNEFPKNFKFGAATSAHQVEGGWNLDGKGVNMWDQLIHDHPELSTDGLNADIGCDSYHNYEEDVKMLKYLGVNYYRFSLSWSRILPNGYDTQVNIAGVKYYQNLIDKLLESGIEPVVTLYHWDLPQIFVPLGGWTNSLIVDLFKEYARLAFTLFGDRVKIWITFNEPRLICQLYKGLAVIPDKQNLTGYPLGSVEYLCSHNLLKAHAEAYHIYDREFRLTQKGKISLTLDIIWCEPASNSTEDEQAAEQWRQFEFGIYANPIFNYDYPKVVVDRVAYRSKLEGFPTSRLPQFTMAEKLKIRGTHDFLGINHYITFYTNATAEAPVGQPSLELDAGGYRFHDPNWEGSGASWVKFTAWGFRKSLNWLKKTYNNPEIVITESGYPDNSGTLQDEPRIRYLREYMNATLQAVLQDGVNVTAYFAWSLMDNYEWEHGYGIKFGLYQVDFLSPLRTRTPKMSAEYFRNVTQTKTLT